MDTSYFDEYPELKKLFEVMRAERRDEILDYLKNSDEKYANLIKNRTAQSMILRNRFLEDASEFEKYMDLIYEQEVYELDAVYTHAFHDALAALKSLNLLP